MFIKLLKHDFLQSGRLFVWQLVGCLAVGGIATILSSTKDIGLARFGVAALLNVLLMILAAVAQTLGIVLVLVSTNRSFFTERGYLLFSLPASSEEVLLSKLLCNMTWLVLNAAVSGGLMFVMMTNFCNLFQNIGQEMLSQLPPDQAYTFQEGLQGMIYFPSLGAVLRFAGIMLIYLLVVYVLIMMAIIFVLTVSHVRPFSNSSGLWTFIGLIVVAASCIAVISLGTKALPEAKPFQLTLFAVEGSDMAATVTPNLMSGFLMLALTGALFGLTDWLLKKKISLK